MKQLNLDQRTAKKIRLIKGWEKLTKMEIARRARITIEAVVCAERYL